MKEQDYLTNAVGVFGHPVAENPTVVIMEAAFKQLGLEKWQYLTIDVHPDALKDAIKGLKAFKMRGINCTIPHKINVIPFLDELSAAAKLIGAVNTIVNTAGRLLGDNTDGKGLLESLYENGIKPKGKKVVVLGAGGAARAISVELCLAGVKAISIVNRPQSMDKGKNLAELLSGLCPHANDVNWDSEFNVPDDTDILINATPIGLYPKVDELPLVNTNTILPSMFVQDVIPNPAFTPFLRAAQAQGARWNTGLGMLINQAAINVEMWTGKKPDKAVMKRALEEALA